MKLNIIQSGANYQFLKNEDKVPYLTGRALANETIWNRADLVLAEIRDVEGNLVASVHTGKASWIWRKVTGKYKFCIASEVIEVELISYWKGCLGFRFQGEDYRFYWHNGYRKSLYKSGVQTAKFDARESFPVDPRKAFIVANSDENDLLLLCLFLLYDKESALDSETSRSKPFLGRGMQESDDYWFPTK